MAKLIEKAVNNELNEKIAYDIINEKAFSESFIYILDNIKNQEWQLITKDFKTPIKSRPKMPISLLQKQFLKAISLDPRFQLFEVEIDGLKDIEPLYNTNDFYYFDRPIGDPYTDDNYIANFRTILKALNENKSISIAYNSAKGVIQEGIYIPIKLEYSPKDDKFRLICTGSYDTIIINVERMTACKIKDNCEGISKNLGKRMEKSLVLLIKDKRNALERCMLHFAFLKKETKQIDELTYEMKLYYYQEDETEVLIRILSFGPFIKVIEPISFIALIKERITNQKSCGHI